MTVSCWLDTAHAPSAPLQGEVSCDVVVIGAGLCGTSAALALAKAGVETVVLEHGRVAGSATGRNAGFILQGTAERYSRAASVYGRERTQRIHALSLENHAHMADFLAEHAIEAGYRRAGSLQLASSESEEHELIESAEMANADGFPAELLTGEDLPLVYREAGFRVGVRLPQDGEVDPVRLVRGAMGVARGLGARLFEDTPVLALDAAAAGSVRVQTPTGSVSASLALVCTNARAGELLPWYADKVDPVRGQMMATAPAPRVFELPVYADHGYDYWRQDELGRVVLGGWRNLDPQGERGTQDVLHEGIQSKMEAFLERFPGLGSPAVTHRWSGTMGFSRDGLPLIGPAPGAPGALAGVGFTGHGFGFAWLAGEALAALALEGQHRMATLLSPRRFL